MIVKPGSKAAKALRGLSLQELETLINLCCSEGKRSDYRRAGSLTGDTLWTHNIMGVDVSFKRYSALNPSFRLMGDGWAITFRGSVTSTPDRLGEHYDIRIGPLESDDRIAKPFFVMPKPASKKYYVYDFRRRGNLDKFKMNLTLLRMML